LGAIGRRSLFGVFVVACVALLVASIGVARLAHEGSGDDEDAVVRVTETGFEPREVEVRAGGTVVFENAGREAHWPASDDHPTHTGYPAFDPKKPLQPGEKWSFTFEKPGEWGYHDHASPSLTAEVVARPGASSGGREGSGLLASGGALVSDVYGAALSALATEEEGTSDEARGDQLLGESGEQPEGGFEETKGAYLALVRDEDPRVALARVREEVGTDDALARSCHDLVHDIGHEAYEKYGDFGEAMKYQDEVCNSGYLHGIIEERFSRSDDVFADMKTMCDPYRSRSFLGWQCYHGLGHGAMYYTANDLPRSLEMCDAFRGSFGRSSCANGVFMENFAADQKLHLSEFLKKSDPFYPCAEQRPRHKGDCYLYAPTYFLSLHENRYADALEWCGGAEDAFESACAHGVGTQAMKENLNDPKLVESICTGGDPDRKKPCVEGMVGLYINHHGALEPARELCGRLETPNGGTCHETVRSRAPLFDS
jgi:plastocyanin